MAGYNLVAIYRSRGDAEKVRERLIRENLPISDIRVSARDDLEAAAPARPGMFDWLFARNVTGEEQAWYRSRLYGDRAALSVRVNDEMWRDRVTQIMEEFDPLEESERAAEGIAPSAQNWTGREGVASDRIPETGPAVAPGVAAPVPGAVPGVEGVAVGDRARDLAATERMSKGEQVIPVVKEELRVGKRPVERRHRIRIYPIETPVEEQVTLRDERVVIERRPASGPADPGALQPHEVEVIERHEEPVIEKRARGVEEVVVRKEAQEHTETVRDKVRETRVEVEDQPAEAVATSRPATPPVTPKNPKV